MRILVVIGFVLWTGLASSYWVCIVREGCAQARRSTSATHAAPSTSSKLTLAQDSTILFQSPETFHFARSDSFAYLPALTRSLLDSLANFLLYHPDKDVEISGHFSLQEENTSSFSNLGTARAAFVKEYLQKQTVASNRIFLSYRLRNPGMLFTPEDTLEGGIDFRILENPLLADPFQPVVNDSLFFAQSPLSNLLQELPTLYLSSDENLLIINDELRVFCSLCIQYLRSFPQKNLILTGHTDNLKAPEESAREGLAFATRARNILEEFGLPRAQMEAVSRGGAEPIASNNNDLGRQKNRRIELSIR